jgi:hypothetical protein
MSDHQDSEKRISGTRRLRHVLPIAAVTVVLAVIVFLLTSGRTHEEFVENHHAGHTAPNGGTLLELGDHLGHFELLFDSASARLTLYSLDGHAEWPVRLTYESIDVEVRTDPETEWTAVSLRPVASALSGETVGDTAKFQAEVDALRGAGEFEIRFPAIEFRGVTLDAFESHYPEGNEATDAHP